jgi:NCS2 family nucleobase:cation symporter-2
VSVYKLHGIFRHFVTFHAGAGMTPEQKRDPNYFPSLSIAIPLGIQHILAMFVSNVTPAIIIAEAAGFGYGTDNLGDLIYMLQMSMLFAGVATLLQCLGFGPIGARLPIVQGTSFAFIPIMVPLVVGQGQEALAAVMTGGIVGGVFHALLSLFIGRIKFAFPPMVTGLVVAMIGLSLIKVGIQYAAGGVPLKGTEAFGAFDSWVLAIVVIVVTFCLNFYAKGWLSQAAILLGLSAGYLVALFIGKVNFDAIASAGWLSVPKPFYFGVSFSVAAISSFCLMSIVSAIETLGDVSAITRSGAGREMTDKELSGSITADGLGTAVASLFGALPNSSFSQNVGLIAITGIMSRFIVAMGAVFLVLCGLIPKIGALITTIPIEVLGGGVIIMFGMVTSAAMSILSEVVWNQRNMLIFALSLSIGFGLQLEPEALQHLPQTLQIFLSSGLLPATFLAVSLHLIIPESRKNDENTYT